MLCVHLGPGRLGLGLIVDALLELDLDVCLVGARDRSPSESLEHEIAFVGGGARSMRRRVAWAGNPATVDDLPPEMLERLGRDEPLLITGSLAHEAASREGLLTQLLERRPRTAETVLLACENDADPMYARVAAAFERVEFCACVVDRIVNWGAPLQDADGRRRVVAHPIGEWVIWHPNPSASKVMTALKQASTVLVVDDPNVLEGHRKRKRWVINSLQVFSALIMRNRGDDSMPTRVQEQRFDDLRSRIMPLVGTALQAIELEHPTLGYDSSFIDDRLRVFRETPGSATRILEKRLLRTDLRPLMHAGVSDESRRPEDDRGSGDR